MSSQMRFSIITPNRNGGRFLEQTVQSVLSQRQEGVDVEYIVIDGGSTDDSLAILDRFRHQIDYMVSEPDQGPAAAINKGFAKASGQVIGWLNADDTYHPGALQRVMRTLQAHPSKAIGFGKCRIINEEGLEIRRPISRFKEAFSPISCRFLIQSINYISQPAMFFRRQVRENTGLLREDLKAAWDYDYTLRLWRHGGAVSLGGAPLADFRWHEASISGTHFKRQFKEEYEAAAADAGRFSPQAVLHAGVRFGITGIYRLLERRRAQAKARRPA